MKVGYIPVVGKPEIIEIQPDVDGSYLHPLQKLVGGLIDYVNVISDSKPAIIVNDEGLLKNMVPNRIVFATKEMEERGYVSWLTREPVKEGDPWSILFGPIVLESSDIDEDGEYISRDITQEEFDFALSCMDDGYAAKLAYELGFMRR